MAIKQLCFSFVAQIIGCIILKAKCLFCILFHVLFLVLCFFFVLLVIFSCFMFPVLCILFRVFESTASTRLKSVLFMIY